jgi:hypothetical protein
MATAPRKETKALAEADSGGVNQGVFSFAGT